MAGFSVVTLKFRVFPLKERVPLTFIIADIAARASSLVKSVCLHISPLTLDENDIGPPS